MAGFKEMIERMLEDELLEWDVRARPIDVHPGSFRGRHSWHLVPGCSRGAVDTVIKVPLSEYMANACERCGDVFNLSNDWYTGKQTSAERLDLEELVEKARDLEMRANSLASRIGDEVAPAHARMLDHLRTTEIPEELESFAKRLEDASLEKLQEELERLSAPLPYRGTVLVGSRRWWMIGNRRNRATLSLLKGRLPHPDPLVLVARVVVEEAEELLEQEHVYRLVELADDPGEVPMELVAGLWQDMELGAAVQSAALLES